MQNFHHSAWVHGILYADRFFQDEQVLVDYSYEKPKVQTWRAAEKYLGFSLLIQEIVSKICLPNRTLPYICFC